MDGKKGLIIVYTGGGKGKTTAALGLSLRAVGYGLQNMYDSIHQRLLADYGELDSIENTRKACYRRNLDIMDNG